MEAWRAARRPGEGLACLAGALLAAALCLALLWGAKDDYLRLAAAGLMGFGAWRLAGMGRRRRTPVISDVDVFVDFAAGIGVPVGLYLRPFSHDERYDHGSAGNVGQGADEEELAGGLARYCVPVAIGRPGEALPARGVYRLYASDDDWRTVVDSLIVDSSVIVLRWLGTRHVAWELQRIIEHGKLARTVECIGLAVLVSIALGMFCALVPSRGIGRL